MKRKGPDPVVYVFVALAVITLLSVAIAVMARGCAPSTMQSVTGDYGKPAEVESRKFFDTAPKVSPEAYADFVKSVEAIDLGIGVHVGESAAQLKTALGDPETLNRVGGGRQAYQYIFPPDAKGPFPDQRHHGGFSAILNSTMLMVTLKDDAVQEIFAQISPFDEKGSGWTYITLNGKPLAKCQPDDLKALLGEPNFAEGTTIAWRFAPDSAKGFLMHQSAYVQASFIRKGGLLSDLLIGVTSTALPPPAIINQKPEPLLKSESPKGNK